MLILGATPLAAVQPPLERIRAELRAARLVGSCAGTCESRSRSA